MNPVYPRSAPINRVVHPTPHLLATGDDDGTIKVSVLISCYPPVEIKFKIVTWGNGDLKLWDPRKQDAIRTYTQHFDFISDFMWLQDKKQLVATRCVNISPSLRPPFSVVCTS
jgi:WD40 repeat protein